MKYNIALGGTVALTLFIGLPLFAANSTSSLWGMRGERWTPQSGLPYCALAGYGMGKKAIPTLPVTANVKDFGAKGDGTTDDSAAFNKAIAETTYGAILIPEGRYVITNFVTINKPNIVLRGKDEKSVLCFPIPLDSVKPNWGATTTGQRTSNYSWGGGFFQIIGNSKQVKNVPVIAPAKRGDHSIRAQPGTSFAPGDWIEIQAKDDSEKSLLNWIYNGTPGNLSQIKSLTARQPARVLAMTNLQDVAWLKLDRPLRFDLTEAWSPTVATLSPSVTNSGIENLRFEFPAVQWNGEFSELGYNAIAMSGAFDCWIRNVQLHNAEGGLFISGYHNTITNVVLTNDKPLFTKNKYLTTKGCQGHHGISVGGSDNLITGFDFRMSYVHDMTVSVGASGNVFEAGRGDDIAFDHHKRAPFANVFTAIDCGEGNRIWRCGGGANLGLHSAGWETFWNLRGLAALPPPPKNWGPSTLNIIGVTRTPSEAYHVEIVKPGQTLYPPNIYRAQKALFNK